MLLVTPSNFQNTRDNDKNNNDTNTPVLNVNNENTENKSNNKQRTRFTKEEDDLLRDLVESHKEKFDWNQIASMMPGRTTRQCRDRYANYLRPQLVNGAWTKEEDQLLEEMYEKYGPQWSKIARHFPNRSDVNIKNHHTCIVNKLFRQQKEKNKSINTETNNSNNSDLTSKNQDGILSPIKPIEINNTQNESNNNPNNFNISTTPNININIIRTYKFSPSISNPVSFSQDEIVQEPINSFYSNQDQNNQNDSETESIIRDIINLARSQQISIDENLANKNLPVTTNVKNDFLKKTFSLLVNLSFLISNNES